MLKFQTNLKPCFCLNFVLQRLCGVAVAEFCGKVSKFKALNLDTFFKKGDLLWLVAIAFLATLILKG